MRILIVEDREIDRLILKAELEGDYELTLMANAEEAVTFVLNHSFDIAILNVMIQDDLDCIELLHDLRMIVDCDFTAFALTSHIDEARARKLMHAGFKGIMQKPFDRKVFDQLVNQLRLAPEPTSTLPNSYFRKQQTARKSMAIL